ncbi:MAG: DUF3320 domain-containing protein [Candidatus Riflebacteria bacterium]|nr:DUF3320 domain-containing protein [Candidatus Riflebacteria bacterium]
MAREIVNSFLTKFKLLVQKTTKNGNFLISLAFLWRVILARRFEILTDQALLKIRAQHSLEFLELSAQEKVNRETELLKANVDSFQISGERLPEVLSGPHQLLGDKLEVYLSNFSGFTGLKLRDKLVMQFIRDFPERRTLSEIVNEAAKISEELMDLSEGDFFYTLGQTFDRDDEDIMKIWGDFAGDKYLTDERMVDEDLPTDFLLEMDYTKSISWAMEANGIPIIQNLRIKNNSSTILNEILVRLQITGSISSIWEKKIEDFYPSQLLEFAHPDIKFNPDVLKSINEKEKVLIQIELIKNSTALFSREFPLVILAFNEWDRTKFQEIGAAFVFPNEPVISDTLVKVRHILEKEKKGSAFAGYNRTSKERIRDLVKATYLVPRMINISYAPPPASFEKGGQKIRFPEQIVNNRMGTCLDISMFFASTFEQMGLNPLILLFRNHASPAVWTVNDHLPVTVTDEIETIKKLIEAGEIISFDSSTSVTDPLPSFEEAQNAVKKLIDSSELLWVLDIRAARLAGILPIPIRNVTQPKIEVGKMLTVNQTSSNEDGTTPNKKDTPVPLSNGNSPARINHPNGTPAGIFKYTERSDNSKISGSNANSPNTENKSTRTNGFDNPSRNGKDGIEKILRIEQWKEKLLDLSLRNRLLNFKETKNRCVVIEDLDLGKLENALARDEELLLEAEVSFDHDDPRITELMAERGINEFKATQKNNLLAGGKISTGLTSDEFLKRFREIYRFYHTELEETGASTLFLALGFLKWQEPDSTIDRLAPIVLYPVEIIRKDLKGRFTLRLRDEEAKLNETLCEKLKVLYGLDFGELAILPEDASGIDLESIFSIFQQIILKMEGFSIQKIAVITFFSFSKFLMWRDLDANYEHLLKSPILQHLLGGGTSEIFAENDFPDPRKIDSEKPSSSSNLILPADASQITAIEAATIGKSFILQGPPGTGKSQTIANIIAEFIGTGKKVLFVSEKKAALEVVADRLRKVGLKDLFLEIHGSKAGKREVAIEIARVLESPQVQFPADLEKVVRKVDTNKKMLNRYVNFMHEPTILGLSNYASFEKIQRLSEFPQIRFKGCNPLEVSREILDRNLECLGKIANAIEELEWSDGLIPEHPLWGIGIDSWSPTIGRSIEERLIETKNSLEKLISTFHELGQLIELKKVLPFSGIQKISRLLDLLEAGVPDGAIELCRQNDRRETLKKLDKIGMWATERVDRLEKLRPKYYDALLELKLESLLNLYINNSDSFFLVKWWNLRKANLAISNVSIVPLPSIPELICDLKNALRIRELNSYLKKEQDFLNRFLGPEARDEKTESELITKLTGFVRAWKSESDELGIEKLDSPPIELQSSFSEYAKTFREVLTDFQLSFEKLSFELKIERLKAFNSDNELPNPDFLWGKLSGWIENQGALRSWTRFINHANEANEKGLRFMLEALQTGQVKSSDLLLTYEKSIFNARFESFHEEKNSLKDFHGKHHDLLISEFIEQDQSLISLGGQKALANSLSRKPGQIGSAHDTSEVGILMKEARKKRNNLPIRRLFEKIPNLLGRAKPCLMMSPLSVAQFLPPSLDIFDLVIFDEASQITAHDAIGAISRARQTIIVGDTKQLPPTSFFEVMNNEESSKLVLAEELLTRDLESILEETLASGVPNLMLKWHYRSRDERLISFSNKNYYDGSLITFPSAQEDSETGVFYNFVGGIFDRGKTRVNRLEAEKITSYIIKHLQNPSTRRFSIGVVTFNQPQQNLIEDLLEDARNEYPEINIFFSEKVSEPVFVKNLENVQGDERDVMIFSTTYGPDKEGKIGLNFGPMNREGGERRLNVAITRARFKLEVFSSMKADLIDLGRTRSRGVAHFKAFLKYAASGSSTRNEYRVGDGKRDKDAIISEIAKRLNQNGWECDLGIGFSDYKIDIGVKLKTVSKNLPQFDTATNTATDSNSGKQIPKSTEKKYILGIELDGTNYASALTARDRERLRSEMLKSLGWNLLRVWTPEWLIDSNAEMRRLLDYLEKCRNSKNCEKIFWVGGNENFDLSGIKFNDAISSMENSDKKCLNGQSLLEEKTIDNNAMQAANEKKNEVASTENADRIKLVSYRAFPVSRIGRTESFGQARYREKTIAMIQQIIKTEGPIHEEILARRLMEAFEILKISSRILEITRSILVDSYNSEKWIYLPPFIWPWGWDFSQLPSARGLTENGETRDLEHVSLEERASAVLTVLKSAIGLPSEILARESASIMGFKRLSPKIRDYFLQATDFLIQKKLCKKDRENISIV